MFFVMPPRWHDTIGRQSLAAEAAPFALSVACLWHADDVPDQALLDALRAADARHTAAVDEFVPLLIEVALATVADVLPGAEVLETNGEMNEDWAFMLRIQRVLDRDGTVLYDVTVGDDDRQVEGTIDTVEHEYLDVLLDLTGEDYFGAQQITRRDVW
jgi:hypothetical protein